MSIIICTPIIIAGQAEQTNFLQNSNTAFCVTIWNSSINYNLNFIKIMFNIPLFIEIL